MHAITRRLLAAGALLGTLAAVPAQALTLTLLPTTQTAAPGATFGIELRAEGLGDGAAPSLGAYDLDIGFDTSALSFAGLSWGSGLDLTGLGSLRNHGTAAGSLNLYEVSLDTADDLNTRQPGSFLLATLQFTALLAGSSTLQLSVNQLADAAGSALAADLVGAQVTVVPEPGAGLLLLAGLLTLLCTRSGRAVSPARA